MAKLHTLRALNVPPEALAAVSDPVLQHAFRLRMITKQVEHNVKRQMAKARKVA